MPRKDSRDSAYIARDNQEASLGEVLWSFRIRTRAQEMGTGGLLRGESCRSPGVQQGVQRNRKAGHGQDNSGDKVYGRGCLDFSPNVSI